MTQESMDEIWQYAKDLAKAEKELKIGKWVCFSFEVRNPDWNREILHTIDIPLNMVDRWHWVVEWRKSKLICQYPRKRVTVYRNDYDKRTGLHLGTQHLLSQIASRKAQITKVEREIARYIAYERQNNLFFDIETDERLVKAHEKLAVKKENYQKWLDILHDQVNQHKNNLNMFGLYIGFQKLGDFDTIKEAKLFAAHSGHSGAFNLFGDKYRDSWYVTPQEAEENRKKYGNEEDAN